MSNEVRRFMRRHLVPMCVTLTCFAVGYMMIYIEGRRDEREMIADLVQEHKGFTFELPNKKGELIKIGMFEYRDWD